MGQRHGLEIRAATGADSVGLAELMRQGGRPIAARDLAERLDLLRQGDGTALIALEWGPPSGLVVLHWYRPLDEPAPTAQITTLLVGPEERRRGVGRLLLKAAAQAARVAGCGHLEMLVLQEPSLHAFCHATGFSQAGTRFVRGLRKKG